MSQFEQIPTPLQNFENYKNILANQVELETIPNLKSVIQNIADSFEFAVKTTDENEFNSHLNNIIKYENYLAEKYRDTAEERYYIKTVNDVIEYLQSL